MRGIYVIPWAAIAWAAPALQVQAEAQVPPWVYEAMERLETDGIVKVPGDLKNCSREELARIVTEALQRAEGETPPLLAEEYGHISRTIVMDEVQWKLAKEQERTAASRYERAMHRAKENVARLSRYTSKGSEGREIMEPAKELAESSQQALRYATRDYLQAIWRSERRRGILAEDRLRQKGILEAIPGSMEDLLRLQQEFGGSAKPADSSRQKEAAEAEAKAHSQYRQLMEKAGKSQELLSRRSIQGVNRLEIMSKLLEKMQADQDAFQQAAADYAQARAKSAWLRAGQGSAAGTAESDALPPEKEAPPELSGKIMEDTARLQRDLDTWLTGAGYLTADGATKQRQGEMENAKRSEEEMEKALARYQAAKERADQSLALYLRGSSPDLASLGEQAEKDQMELRYASWEYARARMELAWARQLLGKDAPAPSRAYPEISAVESDVAKTRARFLSGRFSPKYLDDEAAEEELFSSQPVKEAVTKRFRIDGEVRLDSGHSTGEEGIGGRTRLRLRLYPDYNIDNNWHAKGMIEYERSLSGREGSEDGKLRLDRYYLEGNLGAVKTRVGVFGSNMAEGNIYDSKFKGVHFETGDPVRYAVEYGSINNAKKALDVTATYKGEGYLVGGGFYRFQDIRGADRNIYMANFHKPLGPYDFGTMLLYGQDARAGNGFGYVFSLSRGMEQSWQAGNIAYWLKYYRQPSSTYVSHTMNGMADQMSYDAFPNRGGFTGIGLGGSYTISPDLYFALEYYYLRDLATGSASSTIWGALTGYFRNYSYDE